MSDHELELLTSQVEKLTPHEQLLLIERIVALLKRNPVTHKEKYELDSEDSWTEEELAELKELISSQQALSGKEIVEKHTTLGNIGSWADMGITDGAEWVNQQKAKRRSEKGKSHQW